MRKSLMLARSLFPRPHRSSSMLPKHIQPSLERLSPRLVALIREQSSSADDAALRKTLQDVISSAFFSGAESVESRKEDHVQIPHIFTAKNTHPKLPLNPKNKVLLKHFI